ncbi:MAG: shikimate dehydrogenase [Armatimonadota bacterium]|nr:shikimate dehydrogenase [Armatimonadota bacterium]MDR7401085.1 shikimate dehydrogenase [Armatimonadota bacterium]MDR7403563.1 shikimate dehydrogenase [Armatimonadota bacterium]MDR7436380.1 shikimate dehydrogenase [Armatimonadota bacterium]MDR7471737.1 shikimate dehydrogenase [Armatimonadota bacterium]
MAAIDGRTTLVGVVGDPVAHSLSPAMHNAAFEALGMNWRYVAFRVDAAALADALRGAAALGMAGLNVTVPHKETAALLVDALDPLARRTGAVNTIRIRGRRLEGFNTDALGVLDALAAAGGGVDGCVALILGAGGAGRAAAVALAEAGARRVMIANRSGARARAAAGAVREAAPHCAVEVLGLEPEGLRRAATSADVVVHATAASLDRGDTPRPDAGWLEAVADAFRPGMVVLDMVYTPPRTRLLRAAEAAGARAVSGLALLVYQGARSFEIWTDRPAPVDVMRRAVGLGG